MKIIGGIYDFKGQKVNFPKYDFIDFTNQNLIIGSFGGTRDIRNNYSGGKWYMHDSTGKKLNDEPYDYIYRISNGLCKVCKGAVYDFFDGYENKKGKCGLIDSTGKIFVPLIYDDMKTLSEDRIAIKSNGKWGYINSQGKIVIPATYTKAGDFWDDLAPVSNGKKFGYINSKGETIIPFIYDSADSFFFGRAGVEKDGEYYFINTKGEKEEE
ncbi:MAG: WG repeat-containing protein [Flavobacteriales bacterium]|nr:WG repeat-containing protein [Flavobacteriales bacterium]